MATITSAMSIQARILLEPVTSNISSYNVSLMVNHCSLSPAHVLIGYDIFFFRRYIGYSTTTIDTCLNLIKLSSKILEDSIGNWIVTVGVIR